MHFHFSVVNHDEIAKNTLMDMYDWLRAGLEELGHLVTFSRDSLDAQAVNVLWEFFRPGVGEGLSNSGIQYGIIITEFMDGQGFNFGNPRAAQGDRKDAEYYERWAGFKAAAKGARFFWSMVESNVDQLRDLGASAYVELGYSDKLLPGIDETPDIDYSFAGIVTPYRRDILGQLARRAHVVWNRDLLPREERDRLISRTRINLSINKTADWQMPSGTRVGRALLARRGIALDRTPQTTRQSSLIEACPADVDFAEFALARLSTDWRRDAAEALEKYRTELPMRIIMEKSLDSTWPGGK